MTKYQCPDCGYVYDEVVGDPHEGFPAGTTWEKIPEDWACPDCAVRDKVDFIVFQESNSKPSASSPTNTLEARPASQTGVEEVSQKVADEPSPTAKTKPWPFSCPKEKVSPLFKLPSLCPDKSRIFPSRLWGLPLPIPGTSKVPSAIESKSRIMLSLAVGASAGCSIELSLL